MFPVLFQIGPFTIRTYGVLVALAFFVVFSLIYKEAKRRNYYPSKILDLEIWMLLSGIIGARFLHVLVKFDFYKHDLKSIFYIWEGGLAFYGGLVLAMFVLIIFMLKNRMPVFKTADLLAPYLALGHAIGRIGCFFNGCCFGKIATNNFFTILYQNEGVARYPVQLYAAFALLCIFVILRIVQGRKMPAGSIFSFYLLLYSTQRFFLDFIRGDNPAFYFGLTVSQIVSIFIFVISSVILFFLYHSRK